MTPSRSRPGCADEGFIRKGVDIDPEALLAYLDPARRAAARTRSSPSPASGCAERPPHIQDPRRPQFLVGLKLNLPPEYLLIHRVWLGGIGVLSQIGGTVPLREMVCAYLPGIDESRLPPPPD